MSKPAPIPRLTAVTLGVRDFHASLRFYEVLGFARRLRATGNEVAFLDAGGVVLALYRWDQLADDAGARSRPGRPCSRRRRRPAGAAIRAISPIRTDIPGRSSMRRASRCRPRANCGFRTEPGLPGFSTGPISHRNIAIDWRARARTIAP
jgi:hypothetical protein